MLLIMIYVVVYYARTISVNQSSITVFSEVYYLGFLLTLSTESVPN